MHPFPIFKSLGGLASVGKKQEVTADSDHGLALFLQLRFLFFDPAGNHGITKCSDLQAVASGSDFQKRPVTLFHLEVRPASPTNAGNLVRTASLPVKTSRIASFGPKRLEITK